MSQFENFEVIIFDLDGTLVDSLTGAANCLNHVFKKHGFPVLKPEAIAPHANDGVENMVQSTSKCQDKEQLQILIKEFKDYYLQNSEAPCYPGVVETLRALKKKGKKIGVFTNKPTAIAARQLKSPGIFDLLDFYISDDGHTPLKPSPDAIISLIEKNHFDKNKVMLVGDSDPDIQVGKNAGIKTCFAAYGLGITNKDLVPDFSIGNISELI